MEETWAPPNGGKINGLGGRLSGAATKIYRLTSRVSLYFGFIKFFFGCLSARFLASWARPGGANQSPLSLPKTHLLEKKFFTAGSAFLDNARRPQLVRW